MASASHFKTGEWGNSEMIYLSPAIFFYLKCKKESVRFYVCTGYYCRSTKKVLNSLKCEKNWMRIISRNYLICSRYAHENKNNDKINRK